jgi:toluene monooxygenase system ferredoxin subunit
MPWRALDVQGLGENDMREVEIDGVPLLLLKTKNGIVVVPPHCPHQDECLSNGIFDGTTLTCTRHLWQWLVDPWEGPQGDVTGRELKRYETKVENGMTYVSISCELAYDRD